MQLAYSIVIKRRFSIAEQCAEILQKRFGAKQVIPFGSLVGDSPWHEASDLDLAIEGLSSEAWLGSGSGSGNDSANRGCLSIWCFWNQLLQKSVNTFWKGTRWLKILVLH